MKRGKQTCKILKDIRRQIAEANDIEFITSECQYQGDCLGTCPKHYTCIGGVTDSFLITSFIRGTTTGSHRCHCYQAGRYP